MKTFRITITMADGSCSHHHGLYRNGFTAVIHALAAFPQALRISALRIRA